MREFKDTVATRVSHLKSRSGCRTCKKRRVKCDEGKPSCIRCLSSNRVCEGYGIVIDAPKHFKMDSSIQVDPTSNHSWPSIQPKCTKPLKTIPFLNYADSVTFELFRSRTVREMAGVRSSNFWQKIVLPACYTEPAVLHASMALAHTRQCCAASQNSPGSNFNNAMQLDAVNYYNKAIQYLKAHVTAQANPSSLRIALIACVLFIALELCSGRFEQAVMHISEGRKLLHSSTLSYIASARSKFTAETPHASSSAETIEDEIILMFADLDFQATFFGSDKPLLKLGSLKCIETLQPGSPCSIHLPTEFSSIEEAHQHLVLLMNKCLQFVGQSLDPVRHSLRNKDSNFVRQYLSIRLKDWGKRYDRFHSQSSSEGTWDLVRKQQSALMLVHHTWLRVLVATSYFEAEETDYDAYVQEYTMMVRLASSALSKKKSVSRTFSLEFGWSAPLSWLVTKCRHPRLRREALRLVAEAGNEGLWSPILMTHIGREFILLEEGIEDLDSIHPFVSDDNWRDTIPLQRRISKVNASLETWDAQQPSELVITFARKVWSIDGECTGMEDTVRRLSSECI